MPNMNNIDPKKWLVTFGKSIAYTTRDIVVDKLPNATSILSEVGNSVSEAKDSVENAIRGKVPDVGSLDMNSIKNSNEYRNAMKAIDGVISDIRSGNIAHTAELLDMDSFEDDLGIDFDLDEETTVDENGNETATIAGITNDAKVTAHATIRGAQAVSMSISNFSKEFARIQRSTSRGTAQAVVHATIVSTNLIHADLSGINKRLDIMNTNIASLVKLGEAQSNANEQAVKHYARMEEAFTMYMKMQNDASGKSENKPTSALEDMIKYGFNPTSFKNLVKENLARIGADSMLELGKSFLGFFNDMNLGASDLFNLSGPVRSIIERVLPKKTMASIENFDRKIPRRINNLLSRLEDYEDAGGALGLIAQVVGMRTKGTARIELGKYNKGAVAWSGTSKKALEEVIPHYLASIDEVLHKYVANNQGYEAEYFDYDKGVFRSRSQIRSDFRIKMQGERRRTFYDSRTAFESALKDRYGDFTISDRLLTDTRNKISKIVNNAVENEMSVADTARALLAVLRNPELNLSPDQINDIVDAYLSDIRKERLMITRQLNSYVGSNTGSAYRQLLIGEQRTGHNDQILRTSKGIQRVATNDLYGYADIESDIRGDLWEETSGERKARLEAEEKRKKAEERKKELNEKIKKVSKSLPKNDPRLQKLINLKNKLEHGTSIIPPWLDAEISAWIDSAGYTIDAAIYGDYEDVVGSPIDKVKGYASQTVTKMKATQNRVKNVVRVNDFNQAIRKMQVDGVYLSPNLFTIHTRGGGENPEFYYAELDNYVVGYPKRINASDIDPIHQVIKFTNLKYVTNADYDRYVKQEEDSRRENASATGHGSRRKIGSNNRVIGRAATAKAADTNATRNAVKEANINVNIGDPSGRFRAGEDRSIMESMRIAWNALETKLGGKENVKKYIKSGAKGALTGSIMGAFFLPTGPIGGAILGAAAGILSSRVDFKKILFGDKIVDDDGNVIGVNKTGLVGQWMNTVQTALFDNARLEMNSVGAEVRAYWNRKMVPELNRFFEERSLKFKSATDLLAKTIVNISKIIVNPFNFLNNAVNNLARSILNIGVKATGAAIRTAANLGISALAAPLKILNNVRDLGDYGLTRILLQGGLNTIRGATTRASYFGSKLLHPIRTFKGEGETYSSYMERKGPYGFFGPKVIDGKVDTSDLDAKIQKGMDKWEDEHGYMQETDPMKYRQDRQKELNRLEKKYRGRYLNRQFRMSRWNYGVDQQKGEENRKEAKATRQANKEYTKLINKYNKKDHSQFRDLSEDEAKRRYESLQKSVANLKDGDPIKEAFKLIDPTNAADIENFILNHKTFATMKKNEIASKQKETKTDNFMTNVLHGLGSIVNIMSDGKFTTGLDTSKEVKIPNYGNGATDDGQTKEEEEKKKEEPYTGPIDESLETKIRNAFTRVIDGATSAKTGVRNAYDNFVSKNKEHGSFVKRVGDYFVEKKRRREEFQKQKIADLRQEYQNPYTDDSGQGWRRRPVGHGFLGTALSVGSKLLGGLKTAGSVAKNVGSKVWSGIKTGASVVSNFLGNNEDVAVDDAGNVMTIDPNTGTASYTNATEPKEATSRKDSSQSLSGSLKTGSDRSGNFSEAALDNSYKQNMLSGMNAALFLLSKGAYNPGFSLGKTGGSGSLQMDNVAKKEAQFEVAVGSTVSNLTEKATAAKTSNGKDANAPLVDGVQKLATAMEETPKQQGNIFTTIANTVGSALPSVLTSVLPSILPGLLAGGGLYTIVSGILGMFGIGDGGPLKEALGLEDADGNRTAYVDENGNLVDADDPNAQKQIIQNSNLKERLLSKGSFDTVKWLGKQVANSKLVQGTIGAGKNIINFGKGVADFVTGNKKAVDVAADGLDFMNDFYVDEAGNMVLGQPKKAGIFQKAANAVGTKASELANTAKGKVGSFAKGAAGAIKTTAGNVIQGGKTMITTAGKKVASFAGNVANTVSGAASSLFNKITGKTPKQVVDKGAELVTSTTMWQKVTTFFNDIITKVSENKLFKEAVGEGGSAAINVLKELLGKLKGIGKDALDGAKTKISDLVEKLGAKAVGSVVKKALFVVTAAWDTITGAFDAANLFRVNEDDVDFTMRAISVVIKLMSDLCPGADILLTIFQIGGELLGFDVSNWLATHMYNAIWSATHNGDMSGNKLAEHQAELEAELQAYNDKNGTNLSIDAYNDQKNKTFTEKVGDAVSGFIGKITGKNKNKTDSGTTHGGGAGREGARRTATETGRGSKTTPIGHGRRRRARVVGHGAIDDTGNVDNSMMKGKYTGLQDNGTTIQNGAYYFAQSDPTWSGQTLAQFAPDTIGKSGCVMTSAAMGASTLLKRSINPSEFNSKYGNGNTSMNTRFGDLGLKVTRYPSANSTSSSHYDYTAVADVVTDALRKRKPVMLYGTKTPDSIYWDGGRQSKAHCVLATAMDANGNIIVNNPSSTRAQRDYGWKKTHPITSLKDVHWVQVMEKADGSGASGLLDTSGYSSTGATAAGTNATSSYSTPATTGGANESSQSSDPFTTAWSALASGISALGGSLLSSLFKTNAGRSSNETAPNQEGEDTIGHGRNYKQTDPSVANLPTGNGWRMKDGGCGVATIANMISGHGSSDLLQSSYSASMNHFVDGGLTGDGMAATLSDMGYDPRNVTDTNTLNSLLARGIHVAALGSGHGSSAFPKDSPHWVDLQGYDPFTGKYTWMDPEKGLRSGNLDPSEISSAITIGHGAMSSNSGKEDNSHMNVHTAAKKITAKIYTPTNLTSSEFNSTIDKTARSYQRDPNGFLWNKQGAALVEAEKKYGVNGLSLLGIAQTESGLNSSNKSISHNNATSIMGSNGLKTYGSPAENITGTGQLLGVKYKDWFGTTGTYDIAPHYCPDIPSINQYSSKWADNVTNYTTRFAAIAKGGDGSETQNIETDKGTQNAGPFSISDSDEIPSATISGSGNTYSSSGTTTSQSSSSSSDGGLFSSLSGISNLGGQLLSDLFKKNSGHGEVGHGTKARTGGVSANMSGTGGFVDDSIMGMQATDDSLVTGTTNSGTTSKNNNTKIVGKMDIIISILRAMLQTAQASAKSQTGHGVKPAQTSSSQNKTFTVGHGSESDGPLVRYRPTKTLRDRGMVNRYGSMKNISNPRDRNNVDSDYLRQVHDSISSGARKNLT